MRNPSEASNLAERMEKLFLNPVLADVIFVFPESLEQLPAHSCVLAAFSPFFEAMFSFKQRQQQHSSTLVGSAEPKWPKLAMEDRNTRLKEIKVEDVKPKTFKLFLTYLYTDRFDGSTAEELVEFLKLAKFFQISELELKCIHYMNKHLDGCPSPEVLLLFLFATDLFDLHELKQRCWKRIDIQIGDVLAAYNFLDIEHATLCQILTRETLSICVGEYRLFKAALRWAVAECRRRGIGPTEGNQREVLEDEAIRLIRFPLMDKDQFTNEIVSLDILNDQEKSELLLHFGSEGKKPSLFSSQPRGRYYPRTMSY